MSKKETGALREALFYLFQAMVFAYFGILAVAIVVAAIVGTGFLLVYPFI